MALPSVSLFEDQERVQFELSMEQTSTRSLSNARQNKNGKGALRRRGLKLRLFLFETIQRGRAVDGVLRSAHRSRQHARLESSTPLSIGRIADQLDLSLIESTVWSALVAPSKEGGCKISGSPEMARGTAQRRTFSFTQLLRFLRLHCCTSTSCHRAPDAFRSSDFLPGVRRLYARGVAAPAVVLVAKS